jgi:hypothetical protein
MSNALWPHLHDLNSALGKKLLSKLVPYFGRDLKSTRFWLSWTAVKVLRVYPYFIFHYLANKTILEHPECREAWERIKPYSANWPHLLQHHAVMGQIDQAEEVIFGGDVPVFKLDWRNGPENSGWKHIYDCLQKTLDSGIPG